MLDLLHHMLLGPATLFTPTSFNLVIHLSRPIRDLPFRTSPLLHVYQPLALPSLSLILERAELRLGGLVGGWAKEDKIGWEIEVRLQVAHEALLIQHSYRDGNIGSESWDGVVRGRSRGIEIPLGELGASMLCEKLEYG